MRIEKKLLTLARRARKRAYVPYSGSAVGTAVLGGSGRVYTGANIENASYGESICSERVAIFSAIHRGERVIKAVCIVAPSARPCGACRQVMIEFGTRDTRLIFSEVDDDGGESIRRMRLRTLHPLVYNPIKAGLLPPGAENIPFFRKNPQRRKRAKKRKKK
ncbi:MAG: cytidine deaminase [Elusimicrobiota bacterium]